MTNDILRPGGPRAKSVGRTEGKSVFNGTVGVRHILDKVQAEGRFSVLEHPMSPRALAAPLHRHHNEDEYSWIIEGRVGALLGDEALYGGPGDFIFKPRGQWHTFWNAGYEPARILEIISPAGFEQFFDELSDLGGIDEVSTEALDQLCARYELEMDVDSVPELCKRFDLKFPRCTYLIMNRWDRNPCMPKQCRRKQANHRGCGWLKRSGQSNATLKGSS